MVLLEIVTVVLAVGVLGLLVREPIAWVWWVLPLGAVGLVGWQGFERGLHWQMFPAFTVLLVGSALLLFQRRAYTRAGARVAAVLAGGLALSSLVLCWVLPLFTLPVPTGRYAVGTRLEHWMDAATEREMAVQIWYPAVAGGERARYMRLAETRPRFVYWAWLQTNAWQNAAVAEGAQFPVVLFGHAWGGRRTQDTFLCEELASHGYVVVASDHPGNSERMERADGSVERSDRGEAMAHPEARDTATTLALWEAELRLWTRDNEFVLDQLGDGTPAWLAGHLDLTRVGAVGHSFGGAAGMALLGHAPLGRAPRVRAAVNLDGWTFGGLAERTTEPVLFVDAAPTGSAGGERPAGAGVEDELERLDRGVVGRSVARGGGQRWYVGGTQHQDFTDQTLVSPVQRLTYTGPLQGARVRAITRGLVVSFFDKMLRGEGDLARYPEVRMAGW